MHFKLPLFFRDGKRLSVISFAILFVIIFLVVLGLRPLSQNDLLIAEAFRQPASFKAQWKSRGSMEGQPCRSVHTSSDQCAFVRANCLALDSGLISYLQLFYCRFADVKPIAMIIMAVWLGLLFSTIGIAASDFFCINLSTISTLLGLSESLAGVTFLALGNGSPDVFSTFAAMSTHSGNLAVGELIGAASFITAMVSGSMAIVRPFKVSKKIFVRDLAFFIVAACFSLVFLADGHLTLWECVIMILFYILYVITVVAWHWILGSRKRRRQREARARAQFLQREVVNFRGEEELDEGDNGVHVSHELNTADVYEDFHILERAGGPEYCEVDQETEDNAREQWMAEVSRNMRLARPASMTHCKTGNPIRPSLVGALEFRSFISLLEKSQAQHAFPVRVRRYSDDPNITLAQQHQRPSQSDIGSQANQLPRRINAHEINGSWRSRREIAESGLGRNRAVSMNDVSDSQPKGGSPQIIDVEPLSPSQLQTPAPDQNANPSQADPLSLLRSDTLQLNPNTSLDADAHNTAKPSGLLTIPIQIPHAAASAPLLAAYENPTATNGFSAAAGVQGPRQRNSRQDPGSPKFSPGTAGPSSSLPTSYSHEDLTAMLIPSRGSNSTLTPPSLGSHDVRQSDLDSGLITPAWWPNNFIPSPDVIFSTLFPTLRNWNQKNTWERLLGIVSAPSVFLLTITLPVVDTDKVDNLAFEFPPYSNWANTLDGAPTSDHDAIPAAPPLIVLDVHEQPEGSTLDHIYSHRRSCDNFNYMDNINFPTMASVDESVRERPPERVNLNFPNDNGPDLANPPKGWNRWLVSTQVFTAPFLLVTMTWGTSNGTHSQSQWLIAAACGLVGSSMVYTMIVLKTTTKEPPRYRSLMCFLGFIVSIAWISTIAGEVVGLLKALGVILGISDAILGLTIFAVGNSLGDLVANITVAKLGFPVMGLSACFGGPMLNILLGIGISGLYVTIKESGEAREQHPGHANTYRPYELEVGGNLLVCGATLLITLIGLLVAVPMNNWIMDRKIGWGLVALWCTSTMVNVAIEMSGIVGNYA